MNHQNCLIIYEMKSWNYDHSSFHDHSWNSPLRHLSSELHKTVIATRSWFSKRTQKYHCTSDVGYSVKALRQAHQTLRALVRRCRDFGTNERGSSTTQLDFLKTIIENVIWAAVGILTFNAFFSRNSSKWFTSVNTNLKTKIWAELVAKWQKNSKSCNESTKLVILLIGSVHWWSLKPCHEWRKLITLKEVEITRNILWSLGIAINQTANNCSTVALFVSWIFLFD